MRRCGMNLTPVRCVILFFSIGQNRDCFIFISGADQAQAARVRVKSQADLI